MARLLVLLAFFSAVSFAVKSESVKCNDVSGAVHIWKEASLAFPDLQSEMKRLGESTREYTETIENELSSKSVHMNSCVFTMPIENGRPVDGLVTITTYKDWMTGNQRNVVGLLVEYFRTIDKLTGVINRNFVSSAICREAESCQRRGILSGGSSSTPFRLDPAPGPEEEGDTVN